MDRPVVSPVTEELYSELEAFTDFDEGTGWQLLLWMASVASMIDPVYELVTDRDDMPGWAVMFNVDLAPPFVLKYLAQYGGVVVKPQMSDDDIRHATSTPEGFERGSPAGLRSATERTLTGSKHVTIRERFGGNAYQLQVHTYLPETPDPAYTERVIREEQKPGGIVLDYEALAGQEFLDVRDRFATFQDVKDAYANFEEMRSDLP